MPYCRKNGCKKEVDENAGLMRVCTEHLEEQMKLRKEASYPPVKIIGNRIYSLRGKMFT